VVIRYSATFDGSIDLAVHKPSGPRWHFLAVTGACGDVDAEVACLSTLEATVPVRAGTTYHL